MCVIDSRNFDISQISEPKSITTSLIFFFIQMAKKKEEKFSVIYMKEDNESRVFVVPSNWIKENVVVYTEFPLSTDDKEMVESFLQSATKITCIPPSSWPKYECIVLETYGM